MGCVEKRKKKRWGNDGAGGLAHMWRERRKGKKERERKKGRLVRCRYDNSLAKLLVILERERERERPRKSRFAGREGGKKASFRLSVGWRGLR